MDFRSRRAVAERRRLTGTEAATTALEDYLVTIYKLEETLGAARTTLIAKELGVKPATVSKILTKLEAEGYVVREKYRGARLTGLGRRIAERIIWKHRVIERFLHDYVGLDPLRAHRYAHMMEHLPDEIIDRIYERLGRPGTCPMGNPIPGAKVPEEIRRAVPLSSLQSGACGKIVRITMAVHEWGRRLIEQGIFIGRRVCVIYAGQSHLIVDVEGIGEREVPVMHACLVYVLPENSAS
ncbi:metal-dependent transcriptional regulator [Hyperthermus butylicus]|uniref:Iron dependent repressor n=1 Tax=Hyperthermus butylicus (strain DSM 5456 / JCM 9403 / PLM1-5) TaxID=415426 RepID=A2BJ74_HYPBU|nr:metal-dependent transcriptional regulator [Hyperthermus butylicus]ABM80035.1 putative Iron dependent repressor [Hyperthermus butylicus DSM 5456]